MHVISRKALSDFWLKHPPARALLAAWHKAVRSASLVDFAAVRRSFGSADKVKQFVVFDVSSFRVITVIHYNRGKLYIRHVFTHAEYDRWSDKLRRAK
jgi:mRNA interferase HigB